MSVAAIENARELIAAVRENTDLQRDELARRIAFGEDLTGELVKVGAAPGALDQVERAVARWNRLRAAWEVARNREQLQADVAAELSALDARRAELEAERLTVAMSNLASGEKARRCGEIASAIAVLRRSPELVERLNRANEAWREVLRLLPADRVHDHDAAEAALQAAQGRVKVAADMVAKLDARPLLTRARERLAQLGDSLAQLAGQALTGFRVTDDATEAGEQDARRAAQVTRRAASFTGCEAEKARVKAEIARLESPEYEASAKVWRDKLAQARSELEKLQARPSLHQQLAQEFSEWEAQAARPGKSA